MTIHVTPSEMAARMARLPRPLHGPDHAAAREAVAACEAELRPERTAGDVFAAHVRVLDDRGLSAPR